MPYKTLLLPVDPNGEAATVMQAGTSLAKALGASIRLLHVLPVPPSMHPDVLLRPAAHPRMARQLQESREAVIPVLKALAEPAVDAGIAVRLQVAHGDPADAILKAADPDQVDLIVMGTHARRGLIRAALGSVAGQVVRDAEVPVLSVRVGVRQDAHALSFHDIDLG